MKLHIEDPRGHYYIARCTACPKWIEHCPQAPLKARRLASKHARRRSGHETYVIDLEMLTVVDRFRYDALDIGDEPPF